jgi:hypothetical protein
LQDPHRVRAEFSEEACEVGPECAESFGLLMNGRNVQALRLYIEQRAILAERELHELLLAFHS